MSRRALAAAVLAGVLALVLALAGCGGGSGGGERLTRDEYQQQGAAIGTRLNEQFKDIEQADVTDLNAVAPLMRRLGEALDALADEFDALNPPADVEAAHEQLVTSARATAEEARAIADKVESATLAELQADLDSLDISKGENFAEMQKAMNAIKAKGYDFGSGFGG